MRPAGWRLPAITDVLAVISGQLGAVAAWFVPADDTTAPSQTPDADELDENTRTELVSDVREWLDGPPSPRLDRVVGELRVEAVALPTDLPELRGALVVAYRGASEAAAEPMLDLAAAILGTAAEPIPLLSARQQLVDWAAGSDQLGRCAFAISIDGLAVTNEVLGFQAGDLLLDTLADRMAQWVDGNGRVAPGGGARYLAIRTDVATNADGLRAADQLRELIAAPVELEGWPVTRSASVGVAADPDNSIGIERLLSHAARCGAAARAAGGDRSEVYDETATRALLDRMRLGVELYGALRYGQLRMYYQPEFDLLSGEIVAVEALLRWQHPKLGLLSAESFVPDAEYTHTFTLVQRWAIEESCRQLARWRDDGTSEKLLMRVNVPGRLVLEAGLTATLRTSLERHGLPGDRICVELTERRMPDDLGALAAELAIWRSLGVLLALDDFGVGSATLTHLLALPIDVIKIDQSFVARLPDDATAAAVVRAVIELAGRLGLQVVAEGISDAETAEELVRLGCPSGQGNALAPAMPPEHIAELLHRRRKAG